MSVSDGQQRDSYVYMNISFSILFAHLGCYRVLISVPCAIQKVLLGYLF